VAAEDKTPKLPNDERKSKMNAPAHIQNTFDLFRAYCVQYHAFYAAEEADIDGPEEPVAPDCCPNSSEHWCYFGLAELALDGPIGPDRVVELVNDDNDINVTMDFQQYLTMLAPYAAALTGKNATLHWEVGNGVTFAWLEAVAPAGQQG
jgi:hypothetical protein